MPITVIARRAIKGLLELWSGSSSHVYVATLVFSTVWVQGLPDWSIPKFTGVPPIPQLKLRLLLEEQSYYSSSKSSKLLWRACMWSILKVCVIFQTATGSLNKWIQITVICHSVMQPDNIQCAWICLHWAGDILPLDEPINNCGRLKQSSITGVCNLCQFKSYFEIDGTYFNHATGTSISHTPTIATACGHHVMLEGKGSGIVKDSFSFYIPPATTVLACPPVW